MAALITPGVDVWHCPIHGDHVETRMYTTGGSCAECEGKDVKSAFSKAYYDYEIWKLRNAPIGSPEWKAKQDQVAIHYCWRHGQQEWRRGKDMAFRCSVCISGTSYEVAKDDPWREDVVKKGGKVMTMLDRLRSVELDGIDIDEAIYLAEGAGMISDGYRTRGLEAPQWLSDKLTSLNREIDSRTAEARQKALREIELEEIALRTRDERKADLAARKARLQEQLGIKATPQGDVAGK